MKKLLIIQKDEAYFLYETIQVIEKNYYFFKDFEFTLLCDEKALRAVYDKTTPLLKELSTDDKKIRQANFDVSVNLSLLESSWDLHAEIYSKRKLGPISSDGQLKVEGLWSAYYLTLKGGAPFLTFHLQDIFKNILGIKNFAQKKINKSSIKELYFSLTNTDLFPNDEQEKFLAKLSELNTVFSIKGLSQADFLTDLSSALYVGPPCLDALKLCESGARAVFLSSAFRGFNLLPYDAEYSVLSTEGKEFSADSLYQYVLMVLAGHNSPQTPYCEYQCQNDYNFGAYLKSFNQSDDNYPFYQSHVVLWNFLLNLLDTDLDIIECSPSQKELLKVHSEMLQKLIRLHDYSMSAVDKIQQEAKKNSAGISSYTKQIEEIEEITDKISASHPLIRQVLDFYRIQKGQTTGKDFLEQSQKSFLTYAEEHQALEALYELFSVTLNKNEANL